MAFERTRAALVAVTAAVAILTAGAVAPAVGAAQGPSPFTPPASNPLRGDGMWIWYVKRAERGKPKRIIGRARKRGIEVVLIKSGDAGSTWGQFTPRLGARLKRGGVKG